MSQGPWGTFLLALPDTHSASGQEYRKRKPVLMTRPCARISQCLMGLQWAQRGSKEQPTEKWIGKIEAWRVFIAVSSTGPSQRGLRQQICKQKTKLHRLPEGAAIFLLLVSMHCTVYYLRLYNTHTEFPPGVQRLHKSQALATEKPLSEFYRTAFVHS